MKKDYGFKRERIMRYSTKKPMHRNRRLGKTVERSAALRSHYTFNIIKYECKNTKTKCSAGM